MRPPHPPRCSVRTVEGGRGLPAGAPQLPCRRCCAFENLFPIFNQSCYYVKLHMLCPILDEFGILRVSGRIQQSEIPYETRHPLLLPDRNHLSKLIIAEVHQKRMHGGPQIMFNYCGQTMYKHNKNTPELPSSARVAPAVTHTDTQTPSVCVCVWVSCVYTLLAPSTSFPSAG
ncbi:putative BEL12AG transposon polyprotein [Danaus plexippus plexippus]|uniref:BEL12AG transposon polyprotein n=1 Tax=Danaus plexippus plexippus TaxID=278856 RepID=A0A212FED6_DANPL|nr:putative BEL12AG transposon polyprotein [Danaus plexippus plexippus]